MLPNDTIEPPNPSGICLCGCDQPTPIAKETRAAKGLVAGHPVSYLTGHHLRLSPLEYVIEDHGYETPCWIWKRALDDNGYGKAWVDGRLKPAHVALYERHRGTIPDGLDLDHLCRVHPCVNPDHLEPATRQINLRRGAGTKLNPDKVRQIRRLAESASIGEVARQLSVSRTTVSDVVNGKRWTDVI